MTRKQELKQEAAAWRRMGRDIEEFPTAMLFTSSVKYMQPENVKASMDDRAYGHWNVTPDGYGYSLGVCRALACYWMALECEAEAKEVPLREH